MSGMEKAFFEESFLITKEDLINMNIDREKLSVSKKRKVLLYAAGVAAVCAGVLLLLNFRDSFYHGLCWVMLIVIGLYCISYYEVISPALTRSQSARFYEVFKSSIHSRTVRFYKEKIDFISEERKIRIPIDHIYSIAEGKNTVLIFTDEENFCFVPKRVLDAGILEKIRCFEKTKYRTV